MKNRKRLLLKSLCKSSKKKKSSNNNTSKRDIETVLKLNIKNYPSSENLKNKNITLSRNSKQNSLFSNNGEKNKNYPNEDDFNTLAISIRKLKTFYPNIKDEVFNENYTNGQIPSRTEHINVEENLKSKIKKLSQKEAELQKNQENIENKINNLDKLMEDQQLNIEAINNVDIGGVKKKKIFTEKIINEMGLKTPLKEKEKEKRMSLLNSKEFKEQLDLFLLREDYNTNQKIKEIKESIEKNNILKQNKLKELNEINQNLKKIHDNKKKEIEELYMHYLNILKDGKDTRAEGLSWIIREIFNLDKKVIISFFPKFLDKLCIKYLFEITHINMKISEIEKEIKICKKDFKEKGIVKEFEKNENDDILTQRNNATKENLNKIKSEFSKKNQKIKKGKGTENFEGSFFQKKGGKSPLNKENQKIITLLNNISSASKNINIIRNSIIKINENNNEKKEDNNLPYINGDPNNVMGGKDPGVSYTNKLIKNEMKTSIKIPPIIRIKDFNKMTFMKNHFTPNDITKVNNFFILRRKLSKLREEKDKLKTNEMDRIFKEFQRNNYAQRYNIDKLRVISALIGEDNVNNELFRQERREKLYIDQISKSQLYSNRNKFKSFKEKQNNNLVST